MSEWWLVSYLGLILLLALLVIAGSLRPFKKTIGLISPLIIILVSLAYWQWGGWFEWQEFVSKERNQQQIKQVLSTIKNTDELIEKLKARLDDSPASARGWYLLGRLYASQSQWAEANKAFQKAYQLQPNDEKTIVNYAQSQLQLNDGKFNDAVKTLCLKLLKINPEQPDALSMLAMDAYLNQDYSSAIAYWQRLLALVPPKSRDAIMIQKAISKAISKTGS
ncbi:tetratricopeptide repeat protein [Legionella sp. 16cNR16C]|uniref:tetratricopeptide repeat protein n=1 Tax=Legionella sp. 16cNR16C TaxID=2905656 RepID=UPI001E64C716|nr:tetratricopeptide repeat protein [Legionella sp. 16cNR16C]MCE3044816.1 tetratricopeptide repeat protein [Legionella sp. 16cNR16C]